MTTYAAPATCQHGLMGYCHDDATPAERESFNTLYEHAFQYVVEDWPEHADAFASGVCRDSWTSRYGIGLNIDLRQEWAAYYSANVL